MLVYFAYYRKSLAWPLRKDDTHTSRSVIPNPHGDPALAVPPDRPTWHGADGPRTKKGRLSVMFVWTSRQC